MSFKKGQSGNPAGRPEGSKNKNYLQPSMWLGLIWDDVQGMEAEKRFPIIKWAVEQMMPKIPVLPGTPGDSVSQAAMVAALEAQRAVAMSPTTPPGAPGLENGGGNGSTGH